MKKLLAKASKSWTTSNKPINVLSPHSVLNPPVSSALPPKYTVPAVPHPAPHAYLALLVSEQGILIRPHLRDQKSVSYILIPWDKTVKPQEVSGDGDDIGVDWDESVIIYGIIGAVELFSAAYLLVITGRTQVGTFFEPTHTVYAVKNVIAIPLVETRARLVVNTLASRNAVLGRPSILPATTTMDSIPTSKSTESEDSDKPQSSSARVQFATDDHVKVMTPSPTSSSFNTHPVDVPRSSSPAPSDLSGSSTPTSDSPSAPIAKALASRLSFWTRLPKRGSLFPSSPETAEESHRPPPLDLDAIMQDEKAEPTEVIESILSATAPPPMSAEEKHSELEEKIIKECTREYVKGGMYFAYNFDITRSLQHKQDQMAKSVKQNSLLANLLPDQSEEPSLEGETVNPFGEPFPTLPLWRRVDRQFWWNEHLSKPFIDAGLHPYVLPIMQGYYQVSSFHLPVDLDDDDKDNAKAVVDYVIASRRSRDRAGLRYQRRGVDDDAHVANFVETETTMRVKRNGLQNIFSYVQIRGSIPLFWTQSGYGLKPPPILSSDRTHAQHLNAMRQHIQRTIQQYGPHTIVNLAEQHGKEGVMTQGYREYMQELNHRDAQYHEYDFHSETKGMKYENISKLIDSMVRSFEQHGYLWIANDIIMSRQKGVFRVNCIDCLDRTNVVQSAFARHVLNDQLSAVALQIPNAEGRSVMDVVINDVWANNGDAISRAYAGTSALKGDFTRTGKRDLTGLLNDGVNSLARMYSSTFSDWFTQAVIDFMLGNRTISVFSEFLLKLQSSDPRDLIRLSKIRAEAIATSVERVLVEGERLLGGWTLFSPEGLNSTLATNFEEKVLLLTGRALYIIRYDYTLEKVKLYTRVPLGDIVEITKGPYILSPLEETSRDPIQNAGFVVSWLNNNQITRMTSYSVRNSFLASPTSAATVKTLKTPHTLTSPAIFDVRRNVLSATLSKANATVLSNILTTAALGSNSSEKTFAAFKALPIDPGRSQRTSTSDTVLGPANDVNEASNCKEAVDLIVDTIRKACEDNGGGGHEGFVVEKDVVSLAEAQQHTSVYAKMEYGLKRLLWLGTGL